MKFLKVFITGVLCIGFAGCFSGKDPEMTPDIHKDLSVKPVIKDVRVLSGSLKKTEDNLKDVEPADSRSEYTVQTLKENNTEQQQQLTGIEKELEALDKMLTWLKDEYYQFQEGLKEKQRQIWYVLLACCAGGLVFGIVTIGLGSRVLGGTVVVCSLTLSFISYAFIQYIALIGKIGLGLIFLILGTTLYQMFVEKRALKDIIVGTQATADDDWDTTKKKMKNIVHPSTHKEIKKIKKEHNLEDS